MIIDKRGKILDWKRGNARRGSWSIEEVVAVAVSAYFDTHIVVGAGNVQDKTAFHPVKNCKETLICDTWTHPRVTVLSLVSCSPQSRVVTYPTPSPLSTIIAFGFDPPSLSPFLSP